MTDQTLPARANRLMVAVESTPRATAGGRQAPQATVADRATASMPSATASLLVGCALGWGLFVGGIALWVAPFDVPNWWWPLTGLMILVPASAAVVACRRRSRVHRGWRVAGWIPHVMLAALVVQFWLA